MIPAIQAAGSEGMQDIETQFLCGCGHGFDLRLDPCPSTFRGKRAGRVKYGEPQSAGLKFDLGFFQIDERTYHPGLGPVLPGEGGKTMEFPRKEEAQEGRFNDIVKMVPQAERSEPFFPGKSAEGPAAHVGAETAGVAFGSLGDQAENGNRDHRKWNPKA